MAFIAKFFKKTWFVFLLLIIGYVVVARLNIIPKRFNLFKISETKITDTPVLIKEIKRIGELVTSEFYGEVYADLFEALEDELALLDSVNDKQRDSLYAIYPHLKDYKQSYHKLVDKKNNVSAIQMEADSIKIKIEDVTNLITEHKTIEKSTKEEKDSCYAEAKKIRRKHGRRSQEYKDAYKLYEESKKMHEQAKSKQKKSASQLKALEKKLNSINYSLTKAEKEKNKAEDSYKYFRKRNNLVYIGRGWVKAGFDLNKITYNNKTALENIDIIDSDSLIVSITIPKAELLDSVINPWYIPDLQKGYEIFIQKGSDFSAQEVTRVKIKCVEKLSEMAIEKGIYESATKNGLAILERFFLLLGFDGVNITIEDIKYSTTRSI